MQARNLLPIFALIVAGAVSTSALAQQFSRGNGLVNEAAYQLDRENWREGTALVQEALRSGEVMLDNLPGAYNNLCIGLTGLRKFDEAITACDKAITMKPRSWTFYNNRANIFFYLGQFDRALAEYYKAMTFSSGSNVLMNNIGLALQYRKNYGPRPGSPTSNERSS